MLIGVYSDQFGIIFDYSAGLHHDTAIPNERDINRHGLSLVSHGYGHVL
jgi:hypothetical protein